jgi:hypothetical protein
VLLSTGKNAATYSGERRQDHFGPLDFQARGAARTRLPRLSIVQLAATAQWQPGGPLHAIGCADH